MSLENQVAGGQQRHLLHAHYIVQPNPNPMEQYKKDHGNFVFTPIVQ